jgi:hypothetical protein
MSLPENQQQHDAAHGRANTTQEQDLERWQRFRRQLHEAVANHEGRCREHHCRDTAQIRRCCGHERNVLAGFRN